jgi:hypothetical protein
VEDADGASPCPSAQLSVQAPHDVDVDADTPLLWVNVEGGGERARAENREAIQATTGKRLGYGALVAEAAAGKRLRRLPIRAEDLKKLG